MNSYNVYCNIKSNLKKKKVILSDLQKKSIEIKSQIELLEAEIEEDINGLSMIFDLIVTKKEII